jgi:predicted nucleic acid-binding protein
MILPLGDEAIKRGIKVSGTIGLLAEAHHCGWLNFEETVTKLLALNYRIAESVLDQVRRTIR